MEPLKDLGVTTITTRNTGGTDHESFDAVGIPASSSFRTGSTTARTPRTGNPASIIEAGSVSTHAIARLRTVDHCSPEWFAAMVPAIPDDSTCVVLTGSPNQSAAPMVNMAT
jgi:hypothetical protein